MIALIGIILLIGIVKKNGIMMVDFALSAERDQHWRRSNRSQGGAAAISSDHDDDDGALLGGLPLMLPAPARNSAGRWASRWSAA